LKEGFKESFFKNNQEQEENVFNMTAASISQYNILSQMTSLLENQNTEIINPKEIVLKKILLGDDGDTVPSVWQWGNIKPNGKYASRVTNKFLIKILDKFDINTINLDDEEMIDRIRQEIEIIGTSKKIKLEIDKDKFLENFKRNKKLVHLDKNEIPTDLTYEFKEYIKSIELKKCKKFDIKQFLEGTRYF
jgi:hypothetical protein